MIKTLSPQERPGCLTSLGKIHRLSDPASRRLWQIMYKTSVVSHTTQITKPAIESYAFILNIQVVTKVTK